MSETNTTTDDVTLPAATDPTVTLSSAVTHAIGVTIPVSGEPPTEIRLFKAGKNDSLKGTFLFDAEAAKHVMNGYRAMGHALTIDYDHASLDQKPLDPAKSKISGGLFEVELRGAELWAVRIQWSPDAADAIRRKHWPYISPAFRSDEKTGRILLLLNFALTANPALFGAPQITMASVIEFKPYPVACAEWDADAAIYRLRKWASSDGSGDTSTIDRTKYAQGFAYEMAPGDKGPSLQDFLLPHHDVDMLGNLVTSKEGVEEAIEALPLMPIPAADMPAVKFHLASHCAQWASTADEATDQDQDNDMSSYKKMGSDLATRGISKTSMAKALGVSDDEMSAFMQSDDAMAPAHQKIYDAMLKGILEKASAEELAATKILFGDKGNKTNAIGEAGEGNSHIPVTSLSLLASGKRGLSHDDVLARVLSLNATEKQLLNVTGQPDVDKAFATVTGLGAFRTELLSMTGESHVDDAIEAVKTVFAQRGEIAKQSVAARTDRVTTMLSVAAKEGKITPAQIEGKFGLKAMGLKDPEQLHGFLATCPVIAALSVNHDESQVDVANTQPIVGLSIGTDGKPTTLNGLPYEKLDNVVKATMRHTDSPVADRRAIEALHSNWVARGKPSASAN